MSVFSPSLLTACSYRPFDALVDGHGQHKLSNCRINHGCCVQWFSGLRNRAPAVDNGKAEMQRQEIQDRGCGQIGWTADVFFHNNKRERNRERSLSAAFGLGYYPLAKMSTRSFINLASFFSFPLSGSGWRREGSRLRTTGCLVVFNIFSLGFQQTASL